jgi:hypothetical protein
VGAKLLPKAIVLDRPGPARCHVGGAANLLAVAERPNSQVHAAENVDPPK